jgi:hypothetical protein
VGTPKQAYTELGCAIDEKLMQSCAPKAQPGTGLEACLDGSPVAKKANAAQRESVAPGELNPKSTQHLDAGRQDAFTTGSVDRGSCGIDRCNVESFEAGRNCRGQSGGPAPDYQDVR